MRNFAALFITVLAFLGINAIQNNVGRDFAVTYLESDHKSDSVGMTVTAVKNSEIIILTNDNEAYKFQLEAGASKTLALSRNRRLKGSITSSNVVHVTSTEDIIVYGMNCVLSPSDGFLALPITSLGKEYVIASYKPVSGSQFAVTAINDNTHINISLVKSRDSNLPTYEQSQLQLDRFQTYHFKDERTDLTGSIINSDKPVAVISGNKCSRITANEQHCNFMVEQLLPVKTWGNHFINVPIPGDNYDHENIYRIISAFDGTKVNITVGDTIKHVIINRGLFYELHLPSNADFYIVTSNPCMVMLYIKGISGKDGFSRPVMMSVTPTEQFSSGQLLNTVGVFDKSVTNYIALITTNNKTTLKMDMLPLPQGLLWNRINDRYYSTLIKVPQGAHLLHQSRPTERLTTYIFGIGQGTSVAYPAATNTLTISRNCIENKHSVAGNDIDDDCDGIVDEELQNNIDDDGDGLIDEDLYATSPDLQMESILQLQSCDIHSTTKDSYNNKSFNYSVNSKCVLYGSAAFSLKKVDTNKLTLPCGSSMNREWILTDACGMTVRKSQQVKIILPISSSIVLPQNYDAKCFSDISPQTTGEPSINITASCQSVQIPDPIINYVDTITKSSCNEVIYRKWNINYEPFCGEDTSYTQEIRLVGYRAPILPEIRHFNITSNSIGLSWSVNPDDKECVTGFLCRYRLADSDDTSTTDIEIDKSANQVQIAELLPNTTYIISMYTITKCGRSHTAVEEVMTTLVDGDKYITVKTPYSETSSTTNPVTTPVSTPTSDIEDNTESTDKSINTESTTESTEGTKSTTKSGVNTISTTKIRDTESTIKITDTESTTRQSVTVGAQKDEPVSTGIIVVIVLIIGVTITVTGFVAYKCYRRRNQSVTITEKKSPQSLRPSSEAPVTMIYASGVKKGATPTGTSI